MSMSYLGRALEHRVLATLKLNPNLTYSQALNQVLRSEGILVTLPSKTVSERLGRSAMAKQRIEPRADE